MYDNNGVTIVRAPAAGNDDGSIVMSADVELGAHVRLSYGEPNTIMNAVYNTAKELNSFNADVLHIFYCTARKVFWGMDKPTTEIHPFKNIKGCTGFFSHGEFLREKGSLNQNSVFNLKPIPVDSVRREVEGLLIGGEAVAAAFQTIRDQLIFTNKRIIAIDVQGITGKRKSYTTMPYSKVQFFTIQTPGFGEIIPDSELILTVDMNTANGGRIVKNSNGSITYTPALNWNGTDTFKYSVADPQGGISEETISIKVTPVNTAPRMKFESSPTVAL